MSDKEATARIKINKLLEIAGWRFFPDGALPANIRLEPSVTIKKYDLDSLGENFEKEKKGFVDFLLLDSRGFPLIVLEAKSEEKEPLIGKEQARKYAKSLNCRFVILSNGNLHYFWDLERGNPYIITSFPRPESVGYFQQVTPNPQQLIDTEIGDDFIILTQKPDYKANAAWINEEERAEYIKKNNLRFLRPYQLRALKAIQAAMKHGKDRFLFEMATGTGKTLVSAAVIKLFLKSGNARRVLFLVDRLELEDQANKAFKNLLSADYKSVIYKENRDEWRRAEIVVTTVQSLLFNNKYQRLFSPTDFDLVISDEAHRSIGGNARAVFEYFVGYKLGLTATPKNYLNHYNPKKPTTRDPRETERRLLLDTYRTFGCENEEPTFHYGLADGVKDGYLINPSVIDIKTDVTTQLLSEAGFVVTSSIGEEEGEEETYDETDFEKKFFSDSTNERFCRSFLEHALVDPISREIGKSIIFAVSQRHATKLTQILNVLADERYPGRYQSDFAMQVTSSIPMAQEFAVKFANNNLGGSENFLPSYKTSKTRICVTVGMMTTGYDCTDILNLGLFRPIFSPTDFIQIKGRGTRKHTFSDELFDEPLKEAVGIKEKTTYKLFDYFGNYEYYEHEFTYDEILELPRVGGGGGETPPPPPGYEYKGEDDVKSFNVTDIGVEGMKIDWMFFQHFEEKIRNNEVIAKAVECGEWERVIDYVNKEIFNKPEEYYSLDKLRMAAAVDRRLTIREILEKIFGLIPKFKSKNEILEEEFSKFIADRKPDVDTQHFAAMKNYFKAYLTDQKLRAIIDGGTLTDLSTNAFFTMRDFKQVPASYRSVIPEYIKDYVPLNTFA